MDGYRTCWLCGRNGCCDPLDRHHVFGGALRRKSERYGLVVDLCHTECHIFGEQAVHQSRESMLALKKWGQRKAMEENGWSVSDFIREFGKNFLDDETLERTKYCSGGFDVLEEAALPF